MAATRTPPDRWVQAGLRALAEGGPQAVRIEPLAQALGVSKGGFYWHFKDRQVLLTEMLDRWERESVAEVIEAVEGGGGDARARLRSLFAMAAARPDLLRADLAVREWSRRDLGVAARLRRVDAQRMGYMRELFGEICAGEDEVEARCLLVFSLWAGSHLVAAEHGGRSREDVIEAALAQLLA